VLCLMALSLSLHLSVCPTKRPNIIGGPLT
jgi:hypothetical protein